MSTVTRCLFPLLAPDLEKATTVDHDQITSPEHGEAQNLEARWSIRRSVYAINAYH